MFVKHPAVPHRHHRCHEHSCSQCADDGTADSERDRKTSCVQKDARCSAFVPNARSLLTPDMGIERSYLSSAEPWRDESRDEMLRMTLRVDGKPDYTLVLPALEDYNDFAEALEDIWQQDGALLTYAAVLEAERPDTLRGACELLQDLDNYQRITEDANGYGQQRLQETLGLDDEGHL